MCPISSFLLRALNLRGSLTVEEKQHAKYWEMEPVRSHIAYPSEVAIEQIIMLLDYSIMSLQM